MNRHELLYLLDLVYNRKQNDINDIEQQMITKVIAKIREMISK